MAVEGLLEKGSQYIVLLYLTCCTLTYCILTIGVRVQVRVFSVQRANRSWNARTMCDGRTYHYYLPAAALKLRLDGKR